VIDGIKILVRLVNFEQWKKRTGISFTTPFDPDAAVFESRRQKFCPNIYTYNYYGTFEHYRLLVKKTETYRNGRLVKTNYNLTIKGSLHKNYFGGKNYERFKFYHLQEEINHLCNGLHLKTEECKIQNLEIGVNIKTPFHVTDYINGSVLLHKTDEFVSYRKDKSGFILGRLAEHSQYSTKCYDKGVQNSLDYPLMRFEVRYIKMQKLSKMGIVTLKDLTDHSKVNSLLCLLLTAWDDVLIFEPDINIDSLCITPVQKAIVRDGQNRDHWLRLIENNKKQFNKHRTIFKELMAKHSSMNTYSLIRNMIKEEWAELMRQEPVVPGGIRIRRKRRRIYH